MSKSGVTGTVLQVAGVVLMFVPGAQGLGMKLLAMSLIAAGSAQNQQYAKRRARDAYNASLQDRTVMTASYNGARSIVYGEARNTDGVLFKATHGNLNQTYTIVVALAGHEVESFTRFYLNDQAVDVDPDTGQVTTAPYARWDRARREESVVINAAGQFTLSEAPERWVNLHFNPGGGQRGQGLRIENDQFTGNVGQIPAEYVDAWVGRTAKVTFDVQQMTSFVRIRPYKGLDTQDISGELHSRVPGLVTWEHQFKGIALSIMDLDYNEDVFPSGVPSLSALMKGAKTLDPRTGLRAWSDNPAVCAYDISVARFGGRLTAAKIHQASFISAANDCDISHTYVDSAGVSTTRPLYRCSYVAKLDAGPENHLNAMVDAMAGRWGWGGGQLMVRAGVYHAPVATLDESWLSDKGDPIQITAGAGLDELVNTFHITIVDGAQNHVPVELPVLQVAEYVELDGVELSADLQLSAVGFAPQAQHCAGVKIRDQRQGMTIRVACNMRAWPMEMFDALYVNLDFMGWPAPGKVFECLGWRHSAANAAGLVELTLKETGPSVYQPSSVFSAVDQIPNTALPSPFDIPEITTLSLASGTDQLLLMGDGSIVSRIRVSWPAVQSQAVQQSGRIQIGWRMADRPESDEQITEVMGAATGEFLSNVQDGAVYYLRVRACSSLVCGVWSPTYAHQVVGKTERPPTVDDFSITVQPDGGRVLSGGYTPANRPIDLAGYRIRYRQGTGPFAWESMTPFQSDSGFFTTLPIETNLLLAGPYTLAMVGVDKSGNESAVPRQILATLPNPRLGDALAIVDFGTSGWPGTLSQAVIDVESGASILRAADQATWATLPASWDAWTRWVWDPVTTWTYTTTAVDFGAAVACLPVVSLGCVGSYVIEESHSTDGTSWSSWAALAAPVLGRYMRLRVTVTATGATGPGVTQITAITSMSVVYTGSVTNESGNDINPAALTGANRIGVGDIRLPLTRTYASISQVDVSLQGVTGNWGAPVIVDKDPAGPRVQFYGPSGALADPTLIDFNVRGVAV